MGDSNECVECFCWGAVVEGGSCTTSLRPFPWLTRRALSGFSELSEGDRGGGVRSGLRVGTAILGSEWTCPSAVVESLGLGLCACW